MSGASKRVLLIGFEPGETRPVDGILAREELVTALATDVDRGRSHLMSWTVDLIILRFPIEGVDFEDLLDEIRAFSSASRKAGVLVLADPSHSGDAETFLGRGANRMLCLQSSPLQVERVAAEILSVAPRASLRTVVRLKVRLDHGDAQLVSQTANISATGMLLMTDRHFDLGQEAVFELDLLGEHKTISGLAEVVRHTRVGERISGIGLRFILFKEDGQKRLEAFIERTLKPPESEAEDSAADAE